MAVHFFLHSVLYAIAICYAAEKIIEKLPEEIIKKLQEESRDDALQEISKYLADQPLVCLLAIAAGLYIAKEISEYLVEKFKGYAVEIIKKFVVAPVRENVVAPIRFQLNYLLCYKSNIEGFRTKFENLKKTRDDVQGLVDAAKRKDEVILQNVREWLTNVDKVIVESRNIFEDELQLNLKFYHQLILKLYYQLNLKLYYQRSRDAKEKTAYVDKLTKERNSFNRVSTNELAFESRKSIFEKIMEAVKNDKINMIGIYGMGGVGKTTLVKEVGKRAKDDKLFDEIVMAVVSQSPELKKIQGEIADTLGLKFEEETVSGRAGRLSATLEKTKRILVILDDVWERVELEAIGIPFGEKHRGCKILLTSRSLDVCNHMEAEENFSLKVLAEQEGWNLFRKMAGDTVDCSPDLNHVAVDIAKECAGLPIAIVTVARALKKNKNIDVWIDALNKLRKSTPEKKVFETLEMSYNHLESEEAKSFFLLCCLFPEDYDIPIRFLMMYGIGLRLFKDVNTVDEARVRAHALTGSLISSCLLQDSDEECVKMHDVIRDVAISIASGDKHGFLVRAGAGWKELPEEYASKRYTYSTISLWSDDIHKRSVKLKCPKLQILLLRSTCFQFYWSDVHELPVELECPNLNVLNISSIKFLSLPQSFENLKNLRTLCLNNCSLKDISIVGELKKLEIISLRNSDIEELPKEIRMLTQLKLLDLTGCRKLTVIPSDVIPGLFRLEGLYIDGSFDKWEIEREDKERSNASLAELKHLSHLINLEIQIPHADCFPDDLFFKSLSRFKISVGTTFDSWRGRYSYSKTLKLELSESTALKNGVKELLRKVEHFHLLGEMKGLKSVVYDLDREGFRDLRYLFVEECSEVEHIFNAAECSELQELRLRKLPRLMNLWKDPTRHVGFRNLTVVKVIGCHGLKNLFSHSVAKQLSKVLVELEVGDCKIMEEIVGKGKEAASVEVDDIVFLHLRSLRLGSLPNLRSFCSNVKGDLDTHTQEPLFDEKVSFPQLKVLNVEGCHKVSKVVPFNLLPSLEVLYVIQCDSVEEVVEVEVEGLVVEEGHVNETLSQLKNLKSWILPKLKHIMRCNKYPHRILGFRNLSSIDIYECNSLKSLFSPSIANCLAQLENVIINSCELMESIIVEEREGEENCREIVFPQLRTLKLLNLPNLISFMKTFTSIISIQQKLMTDDEIVEEAPQEGNLCDPIQPLFNEKVSFPQLKVLMVEGCHKVSKVVQFNLLLSLEELYVEKCDSLEEVVEVEGLVVETLNLLRELKLRILPKLKHIIRCDKYPHRILGFRNLSSIYIYECNSLKSLFSLSMANCLAQLKKVEINSCQMMESIIMEEREGEENWEKIIVFPQLCTLELLYLPKLICFMKTFTSIISIQQKLLTDDKIVKEAPQEGNLCDPIQPFFNEKVAFPVLETLQIKIICNLIEIGIRKLSVESFSQLKVLKLKGQISVTPFQLRGLPKLKHIMRWDMYPHRTLGFQNLSSIHVYGCNSLTSLFSPSIASNLVQLQELKIDACKMMESIIAEERQGEDCIKSVEFPQLSTLQLKYLPKLISFMQTFTSKVATQEGNLGDPIKPLFDQKVTLPTIEVLEIKGLDKVKDIWHLQLQAESFCRLKVLEVESCHKISNVIPSNLLKHLTNLEEVSVEKCDSVEIIFEVEQLDVEDRRGTMTLSQLRKLSLSGLPKLFTSKHPILQKVQMDDEESKGKPDKSNSSIPIRPLFEEWVACTNLVELHITNIENLQEIFHTRLADESFSQLRMLEVTECHKLSRVAPSNLLPRLQNLEELIVKGCNSMEKIFELEGEGRTPISLFQLRYMYLIDLPSLLMFCSGKYDFELPSLQILDLTKCPKMQTFSSGLKSTPNLKSAYTGWSEGVWKGDLSSTIHDIFQEEEIKECLYVIKDLVYGLHSREQESSVQEDEDKDQDEEVGEIFEEANTEEQERDENISARAIHHEIQEAAEEEGHQKVSLEAIREHLKVMTNLLDGLGFHKPELGVEEEEEEEESEKSGQANIEELQVIKEEEEEEESEKSEQANIEELQEIFVHLKGVIKLVDKGGLHKRKRVVVIREHLKRMMDLVDTLGLHEREHSIAKLKSDISSGMEVEEGEEGKMQVLTKEFNKRYQK